MLDDSTCKVTRQLVDEKAAEWAERGIKCDVVRRTNRQGYKAGALKEVRARACMCPASVLLFAGCTHHNARMHRAARHHSGRAVDPHMHEGSSPAVQGRGCLALSAVCMHACVESHQVINEAGREVYSAEGTQYMGMEEGLRPVQWLIAGAGHAV